MSKAAPRRFDQFGPTDLIVASIGLLGAAAIAAAWTFGRLANTDLLADLGDD